MQTAPKKDLQRVSNPLARELLNCAYRCFAEEQDGLLLYESAPTPWRLALRERLARSGLATALAGGADQLPDLEAGLEWHMRLIARLGRPQNLRGLLRRVTDNLDWYLDQDTRPAASWLSSRLLLLVTLLTLPLLLFALLQWHAVPSLAGWPSAGLLAGGLLFYGALFYLALHSGPTQSERLLGAMELYDYLLAAYSDAPEELPAAAEQGASGAGAASSETQQASVHASLA